ncbi:MAG TPA: glycosyltransferase [Terrimicrobiaceae bacterium]|nr:glycosyltransferase [Terrimicrobiaceae bacterium]
MSNLHPAIVAVIVTHRRPAELGRLLDSLAASDLRPRGCVIADHAPDGTTQALASRAGCETLVLEDPSNPGPGLGWANGARKALAHFSPDAILFLDDDVVLAPDALSVLAGEMRRAGAEVMAPLLEDAAGHLWAFPEPEPPELRRTIRQARTPGDALRLLGTEPIGFCWCTGACVLVDADAIRRAGFHRPDFWMLGEDLEYSMRLASRGKAVFTCRVSVPHLPPEPANAEAARQSDYRKFCSLLQNLSFLAFHSPHSRHLKRYLPGNFRRFFRSQGVSVRTVRDALHCLWHGAIGGRPAGTPPGTALRARNDI